MDRDLILEHYRNPHHAGLREPFDQQAHRMNPTCGDQATVRIRLTDARLDDVSYRVLGCALSQASASMMAQAVTGTTVADALVVHDRFVAMISNPDADGYAHTVRDADTDADAIDAHALGDAVALRGAGGSPLRRRCALLAWDALREVLAAASA